MQRRSREKCWHTVGDNKEQRRSREARWYTVEREQDAKKILRDTLAYCRERTRYKEGPKEPRIKK